MSTKVKTLTVSELKAYFALKQRKLELDLESRELGKQIAAIETLAENMLRQSESDHVSKGGITIAYVEKRSSIAWKSVCVKHLGQNQVDIIQQSAPMVQRVTITK